MGTSCKSNCPSPHPDNETQESQPPTTGEHTLPAQGMTSLPAQGPVHSVNSARMEIITMNVNSWRAIRDKWSTEGVPEELLTAHVIFIQEHRLATSEECDDAVEWCAARGFNAVFRPAVSLESGRPSCGVGILIAQRDDFGVTEPHIEYQTDEAPRIMALQLTVIGMDPILLVNVYFEDSRGLSELNRRLLSRLAVWQQEFTMSVLGGGDFNIPADQLAKADEFWSRARLQLIATTSPTYTTSKAATTIDYFVVSSVLTEQVISRDVLKDFPLAPHAPVRIVLEYGEEVYIPVLDLPRRLPLVPPIGPTQQPPDWEPLRSRLREAYEYYDIWPLGRPPSQPEKAQILDQCYSTFARIFENTLCVLLDVPLQRRSRRGHPAHIKKVQSKRRGRAHFQSWTSFVRPLHWLRRWVQSALRYVTGGSTELTSALHLKDDLQDTYTEFRSVPSLIQLYARAQELTDALCMDELAGFDVPLINEAAFQDLLRAADELLEVELRLQSAGHQHAWTEWVRNPVHEVQSLGTSLDFQSPTLATADGLSRTHWTAPAHTRRGTGPSVRHLE